MWLSHVSAAWPNYTRNFAWLMSGVLISISQSTPARSFNRLELFRKCCQSLWLKGVLNVTKWTKFHPALRPVIRPNSDSICFSFSINISLHISAGKGSLSSAFHWNHISKSKLSVQCFSIWVFLFLSAAFAQRCSSVWSCRKDWNVNGNVILSWLGKQKVRATILLIRKVVLADSRVSRSCDNFVSDTFQRIYISLRVDMFGRRGREADFCTRSFYWHRHAAVVPLRDK